VPNLHHSGNRLSHDCREINKTNKNETNRHGTRRKNGYEKIKGSANTYRLFHGFVGPGQFNDSFACQSTPGHIQLIDLLHSFSKSRRSGIPDFVARYVQRRELQANVSLQEACKHATT